MTNNRGEREESEDTGYTKEGQTVRNHQEKRKWLFCLEETGLANSPRSSSFSPEECTLGGHMAERMDISCICVTVPTALQGRLHKRVTLQRKQREKAGTLFCGNGQKRTLCRPRLCGLDTITHIQGKRVTRGLVSLLSRECRDVRACGPHPSTASPATPGGAKP